MVTIRFRLLLLVAALTLWLPAGAQLHRGARTVVRGGQFEKPDSLKGRRDPLRLADLVQQIDSIAALDYAADSAAVAALRTDDLHFLDSVALARFDAAQRGVDTTTKRKVYKKGWFMSDSMSLSKVCWISTVVPGYGQIYNKQYWKLPILYGLVGTGLGLYIHENIREDAFDLFGFASREELRCFQLLLGVNGVGPKAALSILSAGGPQSFTLAVMTGDEKALTVAQVEGGGGIAPAQVVQGQEVGVDQEVGGQAS